MKQIYINELKDHLGEEVTLKGWLSNPSLTGKFRFYCVLFLAFACLTAGNCHSAADVGTKDSSKSLPEFRGEPEGSPKPDVEPQMPILSEISKYKKANPTAAAQDLADRGNQLLPAFGFEYDLDLKRTILAKIKAKATSVVKKDNDDFPYVSFPLQLVSETGVRKTLKVVAPGEDVCCCGYYYTAIPLTQISRSRLTIIVDGTPLVVRRNDVFPVVQEYILYEDRRPPKKVSSWEVPFETHPYGLSVDGTALYIDTEIEGLLLEISSEGRLRFVPRVSNGIVTDAEDLRKLPTPKVGEILRKSGEFGLLRYTIAKKSYVLEYPYPCT